MGSHQFKDPRIEFFPHSQQHEKKLLDMQEWLLYESWAIC